MPHSIKHGTHRHYARHSSNGDIKNVSAGKYNKKYDKYQGFNIKIILNAMITWTKRKSFSSY